LEKIGYRQQVSHHLPVRLKLPKAIPPSETFTAFLISVRAGARRFAHSSLLRAGWWWQHVAAWVPFYFSAATAAMASLLFLAV
jgi:hypothetical protein